MSKVEIDTTGGDAKATGVQFTVDGAAHTVRVKREVIVCGGTVNSPQILELSGIGSPEVLQKVGVDVTVDLPSVGENLNDHSATAIAFVSSFSNTMREYMLIEIRVSKMSIRQRSTSFAIQK